MVELKDMIAGRAPHATEDTDTVEEQLKDEKSEKTEESVERKKSFRKTVSTSVTDDCMKKHVGVTDPELLDKLDSLQRPITKEVRQILDIILYNYNSSVFYILT